MASEDKSAPAVKGYVFEGGLVRKGGLNPVQSSITERPAPPPPFGGTGGVSPATPSRPQAEGESSAGDGNASD